ncbi:hypothetical protein NDU88_007116 [Pleurodeles waltl]|uniref:Uncharacterized protein n=1 Tax=Pleurodeles waltl TaxID=8319 RepID=A0AAV7N5G9_PLEWA|nr:hypothetical protein NDU88_007116 [Pleurodeles waltl]
MELAGARDASDHGVVPLLRASLELFRVREVAARVPYRGNQGRASTGPDPSGKKSRILRIPQYIEDLVISGGRMSTFKYLQMKTWVGNVTEEVGSTNGLVDQMQLDIPMKKEVAR